MTHQESEIVINKKLLAVVFGITGMQLLGPFVQDVIFIGLIFWALRNVRSCLQSLSLSTVVIFTSNNIVNGSSNISQLKWLLLFVVLLRVVVDRVSSPQKFPRLMVSFFAFVLLSLLGGYINGAQFTIIVLKIVIFTLGVAVTIWGYSGCRRTYDWKSWFYTLFLAVIALSFPLLFFSAGYDKTGKLFQGILSHPQAFGIFVAPFAAWTIVEFLKRRTGKTAFIVMLLTITILVFTKARTSMLAFSLGLITTYLSSFRNGKVRKLFKSRKAVFVAFGLIVVSTIAVWAAKETIYDSISQYLAKGHRVQSERYVQDVWHSVEYSRGKQIDNSIDNFKTYPVFGVGFGMSDAHEIRARGTGSFLGIPLSTESEMGFIFLALLGQTGVIGSIAFLIFLIYLYKPIIEFADPEWLVLSTTAFFVNFGETILFSTGGLGVFSWLLISGAHVMSIQNKNGVVPGVGA